MLHGYIRPAVRGADYPALVEGDAGDSVEGLIYYPDTSDDLRKLQNFEGELYREEKVMVAIRSGEEIEALAFVWGGAGEQLLDSNWSFQTFESERLEDRLDLFEGMKFT